MADSPARMDEGREADSGTLLEVLGEQYSAAILAATEDPRSARELSDLLDVPIATCYRRIEDLVAVGLLAEQGRELSDRGRRTSVYRRTVDEVTVSFDGDEASLRVIEREEPEPSSVGERP